MTRTPADAPSNFPHWVALGSLAFVLWLFFTNTVSAVRERSELRAQHSELVRMKQDYDLAIQEARLGLGPNAHFDLQALLVAIDQLGYTPFELCYAYPERAPEPPADESPGDGAGPTDAPGAGQRAPGVGQR